MKINAEVIHEFIKFIIVGLINTGVSYLIYLLLVLFLPYAAAFTISYILGILISYVLNSVIVFKARLNFKALLQFPVVYLIQYLLSMGIVFICVEYFRIGKIIPPLIASAAVIPVTFLLSRTLLKRYKKSSMDSPK